MLSVRRSIVVITMLAVANIPAVAAAQIPVSWREDAASAAARASLDQTIASVEFNRMPLGRLLDHLGNLADLSLSVRWPVLNRIGVFSDSPVTMKLGDTTISAAMAQALAQADRDGRGADFAIRDGIVVVSSKDDLARDVEVRVYDISSLLERRLSDREQRELQESIAALWKQHYHVFAPPWHRQPRRWAHESRRPALRDRTKSPRERETTDIILEMEETLTTRRLAQLVHAIRTTIEPRTWDTAGGDASIKAVGPKLVVRQSIEGHRAVHELLNGLALEPRH
jgi:hypothetical protein